MNSCPYPIKTPVNELDRVLTGSLGDTMWKVENVRAGAQDPASAFGRELRDQRNTSTCQANGTRSGRRTMPQQPDEQQIRTRLE